MFSDAAAGETPRLHVAFPAHAALAPLTETLESMPHVATEVLVPEDLWERWRDAAAHAVLVPATLALRLEDARLVPGVGMSLYGLHDNGAGPMPGLQVLGVWLESAEEPVALWRAWQRRSALPLPLYVWACPRRAPFPAIRRALAMALQAAEHRQPTGIAYRWASAEAEALTQLRALGMEKGADIAPAPPVYC